MLKKGWIECHDVLPDGTTVVAQSVTIHSVRQAKNLLKQINSTIKLPNGRTKTINNDPILAEMRHHEYEHLAENREDKYGPIRLGGHFYIGRNLDGYAVVVHALPSSNPPRATLRSSIAPGRNGELTDIDKRAAYTAYLQTLQSLNGGKPKKLR